MNLPNKLTIFRILLVPLMVITVYLGINGEWNGIFVKYLIVDLIFIIASITDKLDGYLARKNNQITTFGKFLDPLADKILVLTAMLILVESKVYQLPIWIPIVVLAREFIVSGYRLVAVEKGGVVIAASKWGKFKTVTQMIAIMFAFIDTNSFGACFTGNLSQYALVLNIFTTIMMIIQTAATVFSGYDYIKGAKELLK